MKTTDKEIFVKDIQETGYYCQVGDTEHLGVYEVVKNSPKDILLINAWIFNYIDHDDRRVYIAGETSINPNIVNCDFKVEKINDVKYKLLEGGMFLIEDKPTYKELLKRKEQECEELKKELDKEHLLMLDKQNKLVKYILALDEIAEHYQKVMKNITTYDDSYDASISIEALHNISDIINKVKGSECL